MKTITNFDFTDIVKAINKGKVDYLYTVQRFVRKEDESGFGDITEQELFFAGTNYDSCTEVMKELSDDAHPEEGFYIELLAGRVFIHNKDYFRYFDYKTYGAEDAISGFIEVQDRFYRYTELCGCEFHYDYPSMENGIIIYWSWQRYVGYARRVIALEFCNYDATTLQCLKKDKAFVSQCDLLVTPDEVKNCKNASELRDLIQQRFDEMDKWQNDCHVDEFLESAYAKYSEYLPENDLYIEDEE